MVFLNPIPRLSINSSEFLVIIPYINIAIRDTIQSYTTAHERRDQYCIARLLIGMHIDKYLDESFRLPSHHFESLLAFMTIEAVSYEVCI